MYKFWIVVAAILGTTAIALGAYSAHGLINIVAEEFYETVKLSVDTAVRYQLIHAILLLVIGVWMKLNMSIRQSNFWLGVAAILICIGVVLFSGMIYAQHLLGVTGVALLVPTGGVTLILGWLMLVWAALSDGR